MRDPMTSIALVLGMLACGVVAAIAVGRLLRARRRVRRRVVEKPNSHYASQLVREAEARHRWHDMALDRIHEINRTEVVHLLARVDAIGVDSLNPKERAFLDRMAELAGTKPPADVE